MIREIDNKRELLTCLILFLFTFNLCWLIYPELQLSSNRGVVQLTATIAMVTFYRMIEFLITTRNKVKRKWLLNVITHMCVLSFSQLLTSQQIQGVLLSFVSVAILEWMSKRNL
jgi:hypothetical protein